MGTFTEEEMLLASKHKKMLYLTSRKCEVKQRIFFKPVTLAEVKRVCQYVLTGL